MFFDPALQVTLPVSLQKWWVAYKVSSRFISQASCPLLSCPPLWVRWLIDDKVVSIKHHSRALTYSDACGACLDVWLFGGRTRKTKSHHNWQRLTCMCLLLMILIDDNVNSNNTWHLWQIAQGGEPWKAKSPQLRRDLNFLHCAIEGGQCTEEEVSTPVDASSSVVSETVILPDPILLMPVTGSLPFSTHSSSNMNLHFNSQLPWRWYYEND